MDVTGKNKIITINTSPPNTIIIEDYFQTNWEIMFENKPENKPNIVLIFVDDLGYGDVQAFQFPNEEEIVILTPELNLMTENGLKLTNFYTAAPICPTARSGLMEGKHTGHTLVRRFKETFQEGKLKIIPDFMKDAGYVTGMFGKWGMTKFSNGTIETSVIENGRPSKMGFDNFTGYLTHKDAHVYYLDSPIDEEDGTPEHPWYPIEGAHRQHLYTINNNTEKPYHIEPSRYTHNEFVDKAIDFISDKKDRAFFLYLPLTIPHAELVTPMPDTTETDYNAEEDDILPEYSFAGDPQWNGNNAYKRKQPKPWATYASMISRLDRDVGKIIKHIKNLGLEEKTVIIFTSDNGPHDAGGMMQRDNPREPFNKSTGGLRGAKFNLYEGGIRVPFIAYWPGTIDSGGITKEPFAAWDILPTLCDIAGIDAPKDTDGISMLPLLKGENQKRPEEDYLYWENFEGEPGVAIRQGKWKAIRNGISSGTDPVELYNLEIEYSEETDVGDENRDILEHLKTLMNEAREYDGNEAHYIEPLITNQRGLSKLTANPQTIAKSFWPTLVTITAKDVNGNTVPGIKINANSTSGGKASVAPSSVVTGSNGKALFRVKFYFSSKTGKIIFNADGLTTTVTQK